ncbi:hypothetical protein HETIRDRAFT_245648, partial [Heterobasidion irregulare TC 32-1]
NGSEVSNKPPVEVSKDKEQLNFLQVLWYWPCRDAFDLDWIHRYTVRGDDKSEVLDCVHLKGAFRRFQEEIIVQKYLHDLCH